VVLIFPKVEFLSAHLIIAATTGAVTANVLAYGFLFGLIALGVTGTDDGKAKFAHVELYGRIGVRRSAGRRGRNSRRPRAEPRVELGTPKDSQNTLAARS
jgi:hypothetical protein